MVFTAPIFLFIFLPIVLLGFVLCQRYATSATKPWLVIMSLVFYGWFDPLYLLLMGASISLNFMIGRVLSRQPSKALLIAGLVGNLAALGWFKYAGYLTQIINQAVSLQIPVPQVVLPLAISFFTFQQIAYLVDIYQGKVSSDHWMDYTLFVTFFPQLIAGPIVHHKQVIPQYAALKTGRLATDEQVARGLTLILVGLFKKVVIADTIAGIIDPGFAAVSTLTMIDAWIVTLGYTLQIYFDFSAYCEIAIGLGLFFGITLPINFNSPYRSLNVSEFWRRWHITLGAFLRDYLYIPLGGSRHGLTRTMFALMATMTLGGLWHGAGTQFIVWGLIHGVALCVYQLAKDRLPRIPTPVAMIMTLFVVVMAWVPFRADNLNDAVSVWAALFNAQAFSMPSMWASTLSSFGIEIAAGGLAVFAGWEFFVFSFVLYLCATRPNIHELIDNFQANIGWKQVLIVASLACIGVAIMGRPSVFIYGQF